ncbi:thioesterase family protein [Mycobacterium sp. AMU20-3851]|uniref:thioesterase family protein n=1 Tax=Mycobacterium sp. AMU20-3851 TaxID=3122055 RepID=UPI0037544F36
MSTTPTAYFFADGDTFVPTDIAQGPWGATISGNVLGGLLGFVLDREHGDPAFQPARLTVDLFRPAALAPLAVRTETVRAGRRIKVVDAHAIQDGALVARASVVLLRRGPAGPTDIWTSPMPIPDPPGEDHVGGGTPMELVAHGAGSSIDLSAWRYTGPKHIWVHNVTPLVGGEPMTPFTRAAMAGDVVSSLTNFGPEGLAYINADYTLTLSRLPVSTDIGLSALTHYSDAGVATGSATLFDRSGPIGSGMATALLSPGFAPRDH